MPYSAPWMTNRCRCSPPQPNAVCTMVCRSATVLSPETSSRRQISGLTACSTARNRYTPGDAAGSDTTSPVGTSSSGTAPSSPLAMLATVVRVGAGGQRDRRPRRGGPAPRARDGRSAPATASRHAGSGPAATRDRGFAHHIRVAGGGLDRPSFAMPEYLRSIAQRRLQRRLGTADASTLATVDYWLRRLTGLEQSRQPSPKMPRSPLPAAALHNLSQDIAAGQRVELP